MFAYIDFDIKQNTPSMRLALKNGGNFAIAGYVYEIQPKQAHFLVKLNGNRVVNDANVKKIKKSYLKNGYLNIPIIVNDDLAIIDGQHRLKAWIELCEEYPDKAFNLLFSVSPNYTIKDAQRLNTIPPKKWSLIDYIETYKLEQNPNYIIIDDFMQQYEFDAVATSLLLSGKNSRLSGADYTAFKDGNFIVHPENIPMAHEVASIVANHLSSYPKHKYDRFITAYKRLHGMPKYDHQRFLANWRNFWREELDGRNSEDSLFNGLVEIHNGKVMKGRLTAGRKKRASLVAAE